jgi:GGDEF domain-containing protein
LRDPFVFNGQELSLGISIGIAIHNDGEIDPEELLQAADKAMYRVKVESGNGYR